MATYTPTPGPWAIHHDVFADGCPEYIYGGPDETYVCQIRRPDPNGNGTHKLWHGEALARCLPRAKANARLIAAAPDMFEALTDALNLISWEHIDNNLLRKMNAALAKAEKGGQNASSH